MPATLKSRFPEIIAEMRPRVGAAVKQAAEVIAEDAATKVPDPSPVAQGLIAAIRVERQAAAEYAVVAGDSETFYGHMVEFGTSHSAARPFLIPALEENEQNAEALVTAALRGL